MNYARSDACNWGEDRESAVPFEKFFRSDVRGGALPEYVEVFGLEVEEEVLWSVLGGG